MSIWLQRALAECGPEIPSANSAKRDNSAKSPPNGAIDAIDTIVMRQNEQPNEFSDAIEEARNDFDERAAISEYDSGMPWEWANGFTRLQVMLRPGHISEERWSVLQNDAGVFCDRFAEKAAGLGWNTAEVFGIHVTHPYRFDCAGLVWLLGGDKLVDIDATSATIRTRTGAIQRFYRPHEGKIAAAEQRLVWQMVTVRNRAARPSSSPFRKCRSNRSG